MPRIVSLCLFVLAAAPTALRAEEWLSFRGVGGTSVAAAKLPAELSEANVAWKAPLPGRGPSGPIVVDGKVIVAASGGATADRALLQERLYVLCFDEASGKELWRREFRALGRTASHPQSANAAPTPASDGERVFVFFSSNDLFCLDLEGNLLWYRGLAFDYPKAGNDIGMSSSPVVAGDAVVVQVENQGDSFAAGLDRLTGETLWRVERSPEANWCSPIALPATADRGPAVLLQDGEGLVTLDAANGREIWSYKLGCDTIPSTAFVGETLFTPSEDALVALASPGGSAPSELWKSIQLRPGSASPIVHEGRVYVVNRGGVLNCADAKTGDRLWQLRLEGSFWATPVVAGNRLYAANFDGDLLVVELGAEEGKIVSKLPLGEALQGSPAVGADALYVRGDEHLWKIK